MHSTNFRPLHFVRLFAGALAIALVVLACQSDEEKIAALFQEAEAHLQAGKAAEAAIVYRKVLQIDPNHAPSHLGLGNAFVTLNKGQEALWEYGEAVRLDKTNETARLGLGTLSLLQRDFEETLAQADGVLAMSPDHLGALVLRGQALEGLDRAKEAEAPYLRAVELNPEEGAYLRVLGTYYERMRDRASAEPALVKYTEVDPSFDSYLAYARFLAGDPSRDDETVRAFEMSLEKATGAERPRAYTNLAQLHFKRDRMPEAKRWLDKGIAEFENEPDRRLELIYTLARYHGALKQPDEIRELVEQAAKIKPSDPKPYLILADYRSRNGDLDGALVSIDDALRASPGHFNSTLRKAELLTDIGFKTDDSQRVAEGIAIADELLAGEPTNAMALFVKGKATLALGDVPEATRLLRASIDSSPDSAFSHLALGNALAQSGNLSAARAEVARAVELDETLTDARMQLAQLHAALGEHEYAVEQARAYLSVNPEDTAVRLLMAQSLAAIGRPEDALEEVGQLDAGAERAQVHFAKGRLLLASGDLKAARDELRRASELSPHHATILRTLMRVEEQLGDVTAVRSSVEAAWKAKPDDADVARLRGTYALRTGDAATAESMFERAIELDPGNVAAYRQLGLLYQSAGDSNKARSAYQAAIKQSPNAAQLHEALANLDQSQGRLDEAIAGYERAIALDDGMTESKNNLAYLLAESGRDLDRALVLAQEAKAAMPESSSAADTLGWVLYRRGVPSAAVGYLREAVAGMDASSPQIGMVRHHLAQAYEANNQKQEALDAVKLSLVELEAQKQKAAGGGSQADPEWAAAAREMLARLQPAG